MDVFIAKSVLQTPMKPHINRSGNNKAAIIIESRSAYTLPFVVNHTMQTLGDGWNLYIFCGALNESFLKHELSGWHVGIMKLPTDYISEASKDHLLNQKAFWMNIREEYILCFDIHSFLIRPPPNDVWRFGIVAIPHSNYRLCTRLKSVALRTIDQVGMCDFESLKLVSPEHVGTFTYAIQIFRTLRHPGGHDDRLCGLYDLT